MNIERKKMMALIAVMAMAFVFVAFVVNADDSDATETYGPYTEGAVTVYANAEKYAANDGTPTTLKAALEGQADGQIWVFKAGTYNVTHTAKGVDMGDGTFDYRTYSSDPSAINAGSLMVIKNSITIIGQKNDDDSPATTLYSDYASLGYADRAKVNGGWMDNGVFTACELIYIKGNKDVSIQNMTLMPLVYFSNKYSGSFGIPSNEDTRWFTPNVTITSNATSLNLDNVRIVKNTLGTKDSTHTAYIAYMMDDAGNSQQMVDGTWTVNNVITDGGFGLNKANVTINMTNVTMNVGGDQVGDQRSMKVKTNSKTVTFDTVEDVVINLGAVVAGKSDALNEIKANLFDASLNPQLPSGVTVNLNTDVELDANITIPEGVVLNVSDGKTFTINEGKTVTNNGTLRNNGTITNNGTLTNSGTFVVGNSATVFVANGKTFTSSGTVSFGEGMEFKNWNSDPSGTGTIVSETINLGLASADVYMYKGLQTFTVTLGKDAGVSKVQYKVGSAADYTDYSAPFPVEYGQKLVVNAVLNTGYDFVKWADGLTDNPYTIDSVTAAVSLSAESELQTFTVTLAGDSGIDGFQYKIDDAANYTDYSTPFEVGYGQKLVLNALTNEAYDFTQWAQGVTDNPLTINAVDDDVSYSATTAIKTFAVNLPTPQTGYTLAAKQGSSSPVEYGGSYTFTFALDSAYSQSSPVVKVNDVVVDVSSGEYTIQNITAIQNITVSGVVINTYTVTLAGDSGIDGLQYKIDDAKDYSNYESPFSITHGQKLMINAVLKTGHSFVKWADGITDNPYTISSVTGAINYSAVSQVQTFTVTLGKDAGVSKVQYKVGSAENYTDYSAPFNIEYGQNLVVNAVLSTGYEFVQWADGITDNPYTKDSVTAAVELSAVSAKLHKVVYNLAGGSGDAPTQADVAEGGTFTVASYSGSKEGYSFVGWNDGAADYAPGSTYTVGSSDVTLTAVWKVSQKPLTLTLTMADYDYGSTPSVPDLKGNEGSGAVTYEYKVKGADDATYVSAAPTKVGQYTIRATVAATASYMAGSATADFAVNAIELTVTVTQPTGAGSSSIDYEGKEAGSFKVTNALPIKVDVNENVITFYTGATVTDGVLKTLTATADSNYKFAKWIWEDASGAAVSQPSELTADMTISAEFVEKAKYVVKIASMTGGNVTADPSSAVAGAKVTLTIDSANGYSLKSLTVDGQDVTASVVDDKYEVTMGNADVTVAAEFTANVYKIELDSETTSGATIPTIPSTYMVTDDNIVLPEPTLAGYEFVGWYSDGAFVDGVSFIDTSTATDYLLYILWAKAAAAVGGEEQITVTSTDSDTVVITTDLGAVEKDLEVKLNTGSGSGETDSSVVFPEATVFEENPSVAIKDVSEAVSEEIVKEDDAAFEIKFIGINLASETTTVKVTLPYTLPQGATADDVYVYFIDFDELGNFVKKLMEGAVFSEGSVSFDTTHNSMYLITSTPDVTDIELSQSSISLSVNATKVLTYTLTPSEATATVVWSSSNESVATVDSTGKVKGISAGSAVITATVEGTEIQDTCSVTVSSGGGGGGGGGGETVKYTVTFNAGAGGKVSQDKVAVTINSKITVDGSVMRIGTGSNMKTITAIPDEGYTVASWSVTEGNVLSDMTISVSFKKVTLTEIYVFKAPAKLTYKEGDNFVPDGLILELVYSDQSFGFLDYKDNASRFSFSPSLTTPLKASDKSVTITFEGQTITQAITVYGSEPSGGSDNTILYVIIAVVIIVVVGGAVFYLVRKKSTE